MGQMREGDVDRAIAERLWSHPEIRERLAEHLDYLDESNEIVDWLNVREVLTVSDATARALFDIWYAESRA